MTDETPTIINGVSIPKHALAHVKVLVSLATTAMTDGPGLLAKVEAIKLLHETGIVPLTAWKD